LIYPKQILLVTNFLSLLVGVSKKIDKLIKPEKKLTEKSKPRKKTD
jgi:hypothetical protein